MAAKETWGGYRVLDHQTAHDGTQPFALVHLWPWMLFPILPLWIAVIVLSLLHDDTFLFAELTEQATFISESSRHFIHLRDLLVYTSFACLHTIICVSVLVYFVIQLRSLPETTRLVVWRLSFVLLTFLVVTTFAARLEGTAQQLTYANVCEMLLQADAAAHILPKMCVGGPPSLLFALAAFPTVIGILAALFGVGLASISRASIEVATENDWRVEFSRRSMMIYRAFYAASAVLVTSTVTIKLFLELPISLTADDATREIVTYSAQGMTTFWGTIFTLILIAVFAPAAYFLHRTLAEHGQGQGQDESSDLQDWLSHQMLNSAPKQLVGVVGFLAPLLVGPTAEVLNRLFG